jgi:hypothetical protein
MDYNNFSHYAKERVSDLRGERTQIEPWYILGRKGFRLNLQNWFKGPNNQPTPTRKTNYQ